jgi:hypothetical protein
MQRGQVRWKFARAVAAVGHTTTTTTTTGSVVSVSIAGDEKSCNEYDQLKK